MSFLDGVWRLIGVHDDEQDDDRVMDYPIRKRQPAGETQSEAEAEIITMPEPDRLAMYVARPSRDGQGKAKYSLSAYVNYLKGHQALILDVNDLAASDLEEAKRVVDYLAGAVRMAEGEAFEITQNVFVFAPYNVALTGDPLKRVEVA
jgi:FtsZ-interacting cell division protein YlmF